jgi:protein-tyrosine phosphatase
MAEALLRERLANHSIPATVVSAGLALADEPAAEEVLELMGNRKLDVSAHRSRILQPDDVARADLVLGMARMHVREAVLLDHDVLWRAFTLKELVRLAAEQGARPREVGFDEWLAKLGAGRSPSNYLSPSDEDDIEDPMGRRFGVFKKVANEIDELVTQLVDLAFPPLFA